MKKTFTTIMPDRIGAFLRANRCLSGLGLNITRVSYNKAVDMHMLFIEAEGDADTLALAERELTAMGYLPTQPDFGSVILMEFTLKDEPGSLTPVLELINSFAFNISYISAQENGSGYQLFKMGLYVDNGREISEFVSRAALLCPIRILDYNKSEKVLDNTVFYLSFANEISEKMGFGSEQKNGLIVNSNQIMQMLDEMGSPPYKTFDYVGKFADALLKYRGENYHPRITRYLTCTGTEILLIEPQVGSNTAVIVKNGRVLCVDGGFPCCADALWAVLSREIPGFASMDRTMLLTHGDVDHGGCAERFDRVYVNRRVYNNFLSEQRGENAIREENPVHAPYVRISKLLSDYAPIEAEFEVFGGDPVPGEALSFIGTVDWEDLHFEVYEGAGGHVKGEMIWVERREKIAFTGDIFVNIKGFIPEQAEFNRLAPYLMTSVDTDPSLAKQERDALRTVLGAGRWQIFGGHGAMAELNL
ncbi:MAG: MBL fold metallo-hydrolase [Clostridia bacterium]|nr:MBL fold metallo-hydrolase [Clostridia bacterium]